MSVATAPAVTSAPHATGASQEGSMDDPQPRMKINNRISATAPPGPVAVRHQARNERVRALACAALAAAILAAVVLAGCGGSSSSGGGTHVKSFLGIELAYSRCMRSHGVPDFPDPNRQGNLVIQGSPGGDLDPNSPALQSAGKACGPFPSDVTAAQERQEFSISLRAASCMRANGVPNFPDPQLVGSGANATIRLPLGNLPESPFYQRAAKKCKAPSAFDGG
jgi:hypothetical protein